MNLYGDVSKLMWEVENLDFLMLEIHGDDALMVNENEDLQDDDDDDDWRTNSQKVKTGEIHLLNWTKQKDRNF